MNQGGLALRKIAYTEKLTLDDVARKLGLKHKSSVSLLVKGSRLPSLQIAIKAWDVFKIDPHLWLKPIEIVNVCP